MGVQAGARQGDAVRTSTGRHRSRGEPAMTTTVPTGSWAHVHRAALTILLLAIALAAVVGVLAVRLAVGSPAVPAPSVSGPLLSSDNGCQIARPGMPC
jgi:hypothetical protein